MADQNTLPPGAGETVNEASYEPVKYRGWSGRRAQALYRKSRRESMAEVRAQRAALYNGTLDVTAAAAEEPAPAPVKSAKAAQPKLVPAPVAAAPAPAPVAEPVSEPVAETAEASEANDVLEAGDAQPKAVKKKLKPI